MNTAGVCIGTFSIKKSDRGPSLPFQFTLSDGTAIDLSGYSGVKFAMVSSANPKATPKVNATAAVVDAITGLVRYDWAAGDLDTPGEYFGEFQASGSSGSPLTCPGNGYIRIIVLQDVAT